MLLSEHLLKPGIVTAIGLDTLPMLVIVLQSSLCGDHPNFSSNSFVSLNTLQEIQHVHF
jgi:hypothetical protein